MECVVLSPAGETKLLLGSLELQSQSLVTCTTLTTVLRASASMLLEAMADVLAEPILQHGSFLIRYHCCFPLRHHLLEPGQANVRAIHSLLHLPYI
jgi:hypothetical protein